MIYVTQFDSDATKSFTQTAYQNIHALSLKNVNFELRPIGQVLNWADAPLWVQDARSYFSKTKSNLKSALIHTTLPDLLKAPYKSKNISVGYTAFETSLIPSWLAESISESYRGLIVPSEYNKTALLNSGVSIDIEVVHHALSPMWLQSYDAPLEKDPETYVFGYIGNWNPRKNPKKVLEAYIEAFPNAKESKTALLLKTYNAGDLETYIRSLNNGEPREDIWVYDEIWTEEQVLWAFNVMDCYVSAHKGEGFGLTLAQAAALGKPVIYTDYSAPTEWLSQDKGHFPVKCKLNSVRKEDVSILYQTMLDESLEWADIDEAHLTETLRHVAEIRVKEGFNPQELENFRQLMCFDTLGLNLISAMERIVKTPLERLTNDD